MGRNGEAENSARRALDLLPTASGRHKGLASTLIVQRKLPEAERVIALEVDEFWRLYGLSLIHVAQGRQREADATLKAFTDKFADIGAYQVAEIYALRRRTGFRVSIRPNRAYRQRDTGLAEMLQSPFLAKVKPDPPLRSATQEAGPTVSGLTGAAADQHRAARYPCTRKRKCFSRKHLRTFTYREFQERGPWQLPSDR